MFGIIELIGSIEAILSFFWTMNSGIDDYEEDQEKINRDFTQCMIAIICMFSLIISLTISIKCNSQNILLFLIILVPMIFVLRKKIIEYNMIRIKKINNKQEVIKEIQRISSINPSWIRCYNEKRSCIFCKNCTTSNGVGCNVDMRDEKFKHEKLLLGGIYINNLDILEFKYDIIDLYNEYDEIDHLTLDRDPRKNHILLEKIIRKYMLECYEIFHCGARVPIIRCETEYFIRKYCETNMHFDKYNNTKKFVFPNYSYYKGEIDDL